MGWLTRTFLYREDYNPALQGLRGLAVLWFFHLDFYLQFDLSKLSRLTASKPWMGDALDVVVRGLLPALFTPELLYAMGGYFAIRAMKGRTLPRLLSARLLRFYPVFAACVLPTLIYCGADWTQWARAAAVFVIPQDIPAGNMVILSRAFWLPLLLACLHLIPRKAPDKDLLPSVLFLAVAFADFLLFRDLHTTTAFLAVLTGAVMARQGRLLPASLIRHLAGPCLLAAVVLVSALSNGEPERGILLSLGVTALSGLAVLSLDAVPLSLCGRVLSAPFFRYFGAAALPFFLIHTTWGFRLSRSILQGELRSFGDIAAHYVLSLVFSTVFAGFLHVFFERPSFLRNAPSAAKTLGSDTEGVSP